MKLETSTVRTSFEGRSQSMLGNQLASLINLTPSKNAVVRAPFNKIKELTMKPLSQTKRSQVAKNRQTLNLAKFGQGHTDSINITRGFVSSKNMARLISTARQKHGFNSTQPTSRP